MKRQEDSEGCIWESILIVAKVDAFERYYTHTDVEYGSVEVFNDTRLRDFFSAYVQATFDPLVGYVAMLKERGFEMNITEMGECAFLVRKNNISAINTTHEGKSIAKMLAE